MNRWVLVLIALAFVLRLAFWSLIAGSTPIDNDGTEYVRAIQNLRDGLGFVGMRGTPLLVFPPLYSILIGFVSLFTGNEETAGRIISIVAGALLPLAVFLVAKTLYGRTVALLAMTIATFSPYFVDLSTAVLTDQAYVTVMLFGLYFAMLAYQRRTAAPALLAGLSFGCAYLLRPEGLVEGTALALALFALVALRGSPRSASVLLAVFVVALGALATPYIMFTTKMTGKPAFEEKTALNYAIGVRMREGMSYLEAAQGIGDDLTPYGAELNDHVALPAPTLRERIAFALSAAPRQAWEVVHTIAARNVLTPLGLGLLLLGFARSWKGRRRIALSALTAVLAVVAFAALLSVMQYWSRYGAALVALSIPWTAKGAYDLYAFVLRLGRRRISLRAALPTATALVAVWSLVFCYADARTAWSTPPLEKQAGLWLNRHDPGPKTIMAQSMITGYYAGATVIQLPYTRSSRVADAYLASKDPTYIELRLDPANPGPPYIQEWIERGIPDRRATLIYGSPAREGVGLVEIYCWACDKRTRPLGSFAP